MKSKDLRVTMCLCAVAWSMCLVCPGLVCSQQTHPKDLFKPVPVTKSTILPAAEQEKLQTLRGRQTTRDVRVVKIRLGLFRKKNINLNVRDDRLFPVSTERVEKRTARDFTWFGKIQDPPVTGQAIMVIKNGRVTGTIQAGGELYEVVPLGRVRHAVVHLDQTKFPHSSEPMGPSTPDTRQ